MEEERRKRDWAEGEVGCADVVPRKATAGSHRELGNYWGLPEWSRVIARRVVPLYSHTDQ